MVQLFAATPDIPLRIAEIAERVGREIKDSKERLGPHGLAQSTLRKSDGSPVSSVDLAAHSTLIREIKSLPSPFCNFDIVSEEDTILMDPEQVRSAMRSQKLSRQGPSCFWLVDPLDGTRDFLNNETTYAVVMALMSMEHDGRFRPQFGVISAPEFEGGSTWWGGESLGLSRKSFGVDTILQFPLRDGLARPPRVLGSRSIPSSRIQKLYDLFHVSEVTRLGSALKFALIADGRFDLYPRLGPTFEWDTAAGHALLRAVGGELIDLTTKSAVQYGKLRWENNGFLALGFESQFEVEIEILHSQLFTKS